MAKEIKNIGELRNHLLDVLNKVINNNIGLKEANTEARLSREIISSARVQLQYNEQQSVKRKIDFLESD